MWKLVAALLLLLAATPAQSQCGGFNCTAPTPPAGTNDSQIATTAFVQTAVTGSVNSQTSNYSAASTDCSNTISLGGGAFFTLTVGAASGFPATCDITISNTDTGRGKKMAVNGITVGQGNILWPGQSFFLKNENNTWAVVGLPTRWVLAVTTAFFVDSTAPDDTNDGLAAGATNAFKTLGKAITNICSSIDPNLQAFTITTSAVTYTEHISLCTFIGFSAALGYGQATVVMTGATLSAAGGSGIGVFASSTGTPWTFRNTTFTNCGVACVEADSGGVVALDGVTYGSVAGDHVISIHSGSRVAHVNNGYTVTGGGSAHWLSQDFGEIFIQPGKTVTCTGAPAFVYWSQSVRTGLQVWTGTTFSGCGAVTTSIGRCQLDTGGGIDTNGGGTSFLPGTTAVCTATNPAWYN